MTFLHVHLYLSARFTPQQNDVEIRDPSSKIDIMACKLWWSKMEKHKRSPKYKDGHMLDCGVLTVLISQGTISNIDDD